METATQHTLKSVRPLPDRLTRDRELVGFVGRHGVVTIPQVMDALAVGRASAYRRVAHCIDRGLLERLELLRREPSLLRATRRGLRFAGLGMPVAVVAAPSVDHWLRCASTALVLARDPDVDRVISERELILAERIEGRPIASAKIGELPDGRPRLHRPDLAIVSGDRLTAIEVELTPKSSQRLREIIRGWRRASWVDEVHYHCEPGPTRRAVERAVRKLHAGERIVITEAAPR
jgi:hypothetical protein